MHSNDKLFNSIFNSLKISLSKDFGPNWLTLVRRLSRGDIITRNIFRINSDLSGICVSRDLCDANQSQRDAD